MTMRGWSIATIHERRRATTEAFRHLPPAVALDRAADELAALSPGADAAAREQRP
jgi:hypothetical protein